MICEGHESGGNLDEPRKQTTVSLLACDQGADSADTES
jgi:hypothetical protein